MSLESTSRSSHASELENTIKMDLARTDVASGLFCDERRATIISRSNPLFNVLFAYAHMDPRIGYVQGMNLITAFFLNSTGMMEHESFLLLIHLMRSTQINHRRTFSRGFPQMMNELEAIIALMKSRDNELYNYIIEHSEGLDETFFYGIFTSMLLTLCIYEVDMHSCEDYLKQE